MKNRNFIKNSMMLLLPISLGLGVLFGVNKKSVEKVDGTTSKSTLPTTIDLNDTTPENIRTYYSALDNKTESERQGTNLLKNLRDIIHDDITYYPYGKISSAGVTQIYTITDRDWVNSPATSIVGGTYDANTNKITNYNHSTEKDNNPYIKMLYVDYTRNGPTRFLNGTAASFDKEHVWSQSHGFKADSGATGPAGTDLHHLIAGEKAVNQQYHSNWSYGNVKVAEKEAAAGAASTIDPKFIISGNKLGTPVKSHSGDEIQKVFEPNDSDKGRIARAILYMAACYNNYSGHETISDFDPNLELVDYVINGSTSVSSSASTTAKYGILSDLLEWNRTYLPDSFEIHRNNLIYNNYQFNRNPFIDFPEWADYIWGNKDSGYQSTGYATPSSDTINGYKSGGSTVSVTGISLNTNSTSVQVGSNITLSATISPNNATNKGVTWTTSNSNIATVNDGVVTGVAEGSATITATTSDGGYTDTCAVTVTTQSGGGGSGESTVSGSATATEITSDSNWTTNGTGTYSGGDLKLDSAGDYILRNGLFDSDISSNMEGLTVTINGKWNNGSGDASTNSYKVEALDSSGNVLSTQTKTGSDIFTTSLGNVSFTFDANLSGCTGFKITYNNKGNGNWQIHSVSWEVSCSSGDTPSRTLTSISLDTSESQTTFNINEDFNYDELVVTAYYDDETSDVVGPTSVSTPNMSTAGTKTVTVTYTEGNITKTATYQIEVVNTPVKVLESISLSGTYPTSFVQNSLFSHEGMVVTAHFSDSTSSDVTSSATFNGYNMSTLGNQTVTVSYTYKGVTNNATYGITVTAESGTEGNPYSVAQARVAITSGGTLTNKYTGGYIYDVSSYSSTNHYITYWISDDGTGSTSNNDGLQIYHGKGLNGADFSSKDDLKIGDKVIVKGSLKLYNSTTYEYDANSILISLDRDISLSSIAVSNYATVFTVGDSFNFGGTVTATYSDSSSANVTDSATFSGYDMSQEGEQTVTVSYTEGGVTVTTTYLINVSSSIQPSGSGSKRIVSNSSSTYYESGSLCLALNDSTATAECDAFTITQSNDEGTAISVSYAEIRIYQKHSLTIEPKTGYLISSVEIYANTSAYATAVGGGSLSNCTKTVNDKLVTLSPTDKSCAVGFTNSSQSRLNYVLVNYEAVDDYSLVTDPLDLGTGDDILLVAHHSNDSFTEATSISSGVLKDEVVSSPNDGEIVKSQNATSFKVVREGNYVSLKDETQGFLSSLGGSTVGIQYISQTSDRTRLGITIDSSGIVTSCVTKDTSYTHKNFKPNYNSGNSRFAFYGNTSYSSTFSIYKKSAQVEADSWSSSFLSDTYNCNLNTWSEMSASYGALSGSAQKEIISCIAMDDSNYCKRSQAMARYEYILSHYEVNNFITGRNVSPAKPNVLPVLFGKSANNVAVIIVISLISVSAIGGYFFLKSRKKEEF